MSGDQEQGGATPRTVIDPGTGRPVLLAPRRQARPNNTSQATDGICPFCPGNEKQTPPEADAVRMAGTAKDSPGWRVRAFPNLYPATEHHEVVAEGDAHSTLPHELDANLWADAIALYQRRMAALEARAGVRTACWFKNVGAAAGASMAHNHSQILGLPFVPPRLELELAQTRARGNCLWCDELRSAEAAGRIVRAEPEYVLFVPTVPKLPNETWLVPRQHGADLLRADPKALGTSLHMLFRAVFGAFGPVAFNVWLHRIPGIDFHWHFELQPRTGQVAGFELGGDMYINSVAPETSARRLRSALS